MATDLVVGDFYHTGFVVPDVEEAAARLSRVGGYRWTKPMEHTVAVETTNGPISIPFKLAYSLDAPHLELIQEVPGSLWSTGGSTAAHHIGFWTDDVQSAGAALERAGFTWEAHRAGDGPPGFAFYRDPAGIRIELVHRGDFGDWPEFLRSMTP